MHGLALGTYEPLDENLRTPHSFPALSGTGGPHDIGRPDPRAKCFSRKGRTLFGSGLPKSLVPHSKRLRLDYRFGVPVSLGPCPLSLLSRLSLLFAPWASAATGAVDGGLDGLAD